MKGKTNSQIGGLRGEKLNISLKTNQFNHNDLIGAAIRIIYAESTIEYIWNGSEFTVEVPPYVEYSVEYGAVEGYATPAKFMTTAVKDNARSISAVYKTEMVSVTLNADNGASVNGAKVTINGKSHTWNGTTITQKVAFGTTYSVSVGALDGFSTPSAQNNISANQTSRSLTFTYIASAVKINILSNQGTDAVIAAVKATVAYGNTTLQVSNGQLVNLPNGVNVTISFPEVEGYLKPSDITFTHSGGLVEKSSTYQCELLTVNVSADSGTISGYKVLIEAVEYLDAAHKYRRISYIQSNGNQLIYPNVDYYTDTRIEIKGRVDNGGGIGYIFGGTYEIGGGGNLEGLMLEYTDLEKWKFYYGSKSATATGRGFGPGEFNIEINANVCNIDFIYDLGYEDHLTITVEEHSIVNQPYGYNALFGGWPTGTTHYGPGYTLYSYKQYRGSSLTNDFVPALRESDNMAGLFDTVTGTFYSSVGSKNFSYDASSAGTIIATQTTATGTYKIPFNTSYIVKSSSISKYEIPDPVIRIANSKSFTINQLYKLINIIDLSLYDVYGNPINRSTANCYVIREPGQYKFPCVYGNAIKNGKVNTAAFTNNGGAYSHDFVDFSRNIITSPYIIENLEGYHVPWLENCDDENVISTSSLFASFNNGIAYVNFTVNSVPNEGANAIISITIDGTVLWSWHIWIWPHDLSPVEITNSTGVKYNIMPVNLASKYDSDGVHIKNWFYQWGRKDPMLCPSSYNSSTNHNPGKIAINSKATYLSQGISGPTKFFYNSSSPYNWFGTKSYYNLWDAACTGTGNSDNDTVKTVYDPCPVGWKVPNGNTFTGLSKISVANGIMKMSRYSGDTVGVGFPMSGLRSGSDGSLISVGSLGCVWLSSARTQSSAYGLLFDSGGVGPQRNDYRASGCSVRPVEDDNIQLDVIMINFTIAETTYQAESGMTWFEWVNSEYNTGGFVVTSNGYIDNTAGNNVESATSSSVIISGYSYRLTK